VIDAHLASTQSAKPLFLYLTHQSVHEPLQSPAEYAAKCGHVTDAKRKVFCGMVGALDDAVYQVTSHMEARGLWDDTLFVCVPSAQHAGLPILCIDGRSEEMCCWPGFTRTMGATWRCRGTTGRCEAASTRCEHTDAPLNTHHPCPSVHGS